MQLVSTNKMNMDRANVDLLAWITIGVTLLGIVVAVSLGVWTYNHRYDASAEASDSMKFTFTETRNVAAKSFTQSAGKVYYGYWQDSGKTPVKYRFYYKRSEWSEYYIEDDAVWIYENDEYDGDYKFSSRSKSQKYDFKVKKMTKQNANSKLIVDWAVK